LSWWNSRRPKPGQCCSSFPVQVPAGVGFLKNAGLVTDGTAEELEGLAGILPVFRVDAA
jgi:hypothetical protein